MTRFKPSKNDDSFDHDLNDREIMQDYGIDKPFDMQKIKSRAVNNDSYEPDMDDISGFANSD